MTKHITRGLVVMVALAAALVMAGEKTAEGPMEGEAAVQGYAIGIDLGTTFSVAAYMKKGKGVEIIPNDQGNRITPSVVGFTDTEILVGEAAVNQLVQNPENTIFEIKRLIGRAWEDKVSTRGGEEIFFRKKGFLFLLTRADARTLHRKFNETSNCSHTRLSRRTTSRSLR
jgi:molecular chaperone DnaK (HSP70)